MKQIGAGKKDQLGVGKNLRMGSAGNAHFDGFGIGIALLAAAYTLEILVAGGVYGGATPYPFEIHRNLLVDFGGRHTSCGMVMNGGSQQQIVELE